MAEEEDRDPGEQPSEEAVEPHGAEGEHPHRHHPGEEPFFSHRARIIVAFTVFMIGIIVAACGAAVDADVFYFGGGGMICIGFAWLVISNLAARIRHRR